MKTTAHIRSAFTDFFVRHGHTHVASSPLVPHNDPTLLFTSAGMVQFKDLFTGLEKRSYTRATTSQKCLRAGGKHNDLENVGFTARHHTFFEMLGNFSFGDYFKEEAISLAWSCITKEYGLSKDRLLVTVYSEDEEAATLWRKIAGLEEGRIIPISTSDNFWSAGDTGPCGPCSEIFYDHGDKIPGGPPGSADADGDRFTEVWNLVFMQFDQLATGERVALPKPSIDTGMGLERLTTVMQGIHNNYETDLFIALIEACEEAAHVKATGQNIASFRVIADHLRASCFLMADGILPSNEGRGYVLRRIMRRAMRHAHLLGTKDPLLHALLPALITQMGAAYAELVRAEPLIHQTLRREEERFREMLDRGLKLLNEETTHLDASAALPGNVAFKLYDTFGFPLDLTQDALKSQGRQVDVAGFEAAMAKQRAESRAHWAGSGEAKADHVWFDLHEKWGATEFLGYDLEQAEGKIVACVQKGVPTLTAATGETVTILANQTPFYGESGGQMGDTGLIVTNDKCTIKVTDTVKKLGKLHVHIGTVESGTLTVGVSARFTVDKGRRTALRHHHSATHILHAALRHVLGTHVTQKGSLVTPDKLRFDFSHAAPLTGEEIRQVTRLVNTHIRRNTPVNTQVLLADDAIKSGAMALFGEKYGEEVRVVSMGNMGDEGLAKDDAGDDAVAFSVELCGGTHVKRTGDMGLVRIISESGVSSGVRRIEAVAGEAVDKFVDEYENTIVEACNIIKSTPYDLPQKIKALLEEKKKCDGEIRTLKQRLLHGEGSSSNQITMEEIQGVRVVFHRVEGTSTGDLRSIVDKLKSDLRSGIVVAANTNDDKVSLMVGITPDLTTRVSAVPLIQAGSAALGGSGGGGRADFAQGGGPDKNGLERAFSAIRAAIENYG